MHQCLASPAGGGATLPACATPRSQRARLLEGDGTSLDRLCESWCTGNIVLWLFPSLCGIVVVLSCCMVLCLEAFVRDGRARGGVGGGEEKH